MKRNYFFGLSFALLASVFFSLNTGIIKLNNVLSLLIGNGPADQVSIAQEVRGPRVLAAVLVGATLGIAGILSQGALKNPLSEPVLLGTTGGSAFFTLIGILIFKLEIGTPSAIAFGIFGALIATLITYQIGKDGKDGFSFVIIGIAISAILTAVVGLTTLMINKPEARGVTFWTLGTLSMATKNQVLLLLPLLLLVWVFGYLLSPKLDYLALGDIRAKLLGADPNQIRYRAFFLIAISIGAITSIFGQISFLALAIPHISRALFSYRNRVAILASGLIGALTLVLADLAARTLASPNELPIGLVTALIGSPVLIYSVKKWTSKNA